MLSPGVSQYKCSGHDNPCHSCQTKLYLLFSNQCLLSSINMETGVSTNSAVFVCLHHFLPVCGCHVQGAAWLLTWLSLEVRYLWLNANASHYTVLGCFFGIPASVGHLDILHKTCRTLPPFFLLVACLWLGNNSWHSMSLPSIGD